MALRQALGYALRTRPLGEADLIVEIFTRERGRIRGVARSARRLKSRFGSAFEPFTLSRVVWFQRDKDDLGRLSSCDIERSYFETLSGLEQAGVASYLAELVIGFTPEQDPSDTLFRLIGASLDALDARVAPDVVARYAEVWILRLSGLLPDVDRCGACGEQLGADAWVSDTTLEFLHARECMGQHGRRRVSPAALGLLRHMLRNGPERLGDVPAGALRGLAAVMEVIVCGHLDRPPRSLRVLQRLARTPE